MKLKHKLIVLSGGLLLLAIVVGVVGLSGMKQSNLRLKTVYEDRTVALDQITRIERAMLQSLAEAQRAFTQNDSRATALKKIQDYEQVIHVNWTDYMATYLTPEESRLAAKLEILLKGPYQNFYKSIDKAFRSEQPRVVAGLLIVTDAAQADALVLINGLRQIQTDVAKAEYLAANAQYADFTNGLSGILLLGCLLSLVVVKLLISSIYRELGGEPAYANQVVKRIASGDLSVTVTVAPKDQLSLLNAMSEMRQQLAKNVGHILSACRGVELASAEIATGNQDLSNRSEMFAASLEESAASLDSLRHGLEQYAQDGLSLSARGERAQTLAKDSQKVMNDVHANMNLIQMSSVKITEITGIIDTISFQTNILALNAAVEAARAGAQGAGFAVVANEVRALAQRSTAAAKEIRQLINQTVSYVDKGASLIQVTSGNMQKMMESIDDMAALQRDFTERGQQQAFDLAQLSKAFKEIDLHNQNNVALVEENAAAATVLSQQTSELRQIVASFKVEAAEVSNKVHHSYTLRSVAETANDVDDACSAQEQVLLNYG